MASIDTRSVETLKIIMICASTITIIGVQEAVRIPSDMAESISSVRDDACMPELEYRAIRN